MVPAQSRSSTAVSPRSSIRSTRAPDPFGRHAQRAGPDADDDVTLAGDLQCRLQTVADNVDAAIGDSVPG